MQAISNIVDRALGQRPTEAPTQPVLDPTEKMHAVLWKGKNKVSYEEVPRPHIADPRDVVVRVTATTICGSDLHLFSGGMATMKDGDILGHEFMGIIEECGDKVKSLKIGQRVVTSFDIACGDCEFCKREEYTGCCTTNSSNLQQQMYGTRTAALFGYSHLTGGVPGGQAEYVRVPFADMNCLPIPDKIPDDQALYLSDIIPTAYHGLELGEVKKGDNVAIWGLGPIGLMCARWCQIRGCARIIGIDNVQDRLAVATDKLGIDVIDFKKKDVVKTILGFFPNGIDVAIEAAGFECTKSIRHKVEMSVGLETDPSDIFTEMFSCVRAFGRVSVLGVYVGNANHFPVGMMMEKGLSVRCGQSPTQKYWKKCLESLASGEMDTNFVVTVRASLSDAPKLYDLFQKREQNVIKVFLRPDGLVAQQKLVKDSDLIVDEQAKKVDQGAGKV